MNSFTKRLLSTLVLAPVFLWILYAGGAVLLSVLIAAMIIAVLEWERMALKDTVRVRSVILLLLGSLYIAVALSGVFEIREDYPILCLCLLLGIWGSDIGGYIFGKFIGGPKMAPKISPNKTWAGLFGACLIPVIVMVVIPLYMIDTTQNLNEFMLVLSGLAIGILGQIGDLSVSKMKRFVGVKDTGNIIPGHGGILDRIDALLLVFIVFWGLTEFGLVTWPFVQ